MSGVITTRAGNGSPVGWGIVFNEDVYSTSLANDISLVKPWKSLAVALTDLYGWPSTRDCQHACKDKGLQETKIRD